MDAVVEALERNGYKRLPTPLVVGGAIFDFDAALRGTGVFHDLVLVVSALSSPKRLTHLLRGLSRTLDQVKSRRPVSVVVVGHTPPQDARDLERHARVLKVASVDPTPEEIDRAISVLLPLALPRTATQSREPLQEVAAKLGRRLTAEHQLLLDASRGGPDSVRDTFRGFMDEVDAAPGPGST